MKLLKDHTSSVWDKILIFVCIFMLFTQLRALLRVFFPSINEIIFLLAGCVIVAYLVKELFWKKAYVWLLTYFLVVLLNFLSGDFYFDSLGDAIQEVAILFFTSAIVYYSMQRQKVQLSKHLLFLTLLLIIYYSISSLKIEINNPGIIRETVYMANIGETTFLNNLYFQGLINYQLPHALPILIPPLIMNVREKKNSWIWRLLYLSALIAIAVIVYISNAATALFLSVLMLILSWIVRKETLGKNVPWIILIAIIAVPFLYNIDVILKPLLRLFSSTENTLYYDKIESILRSSEMGTATGSVASREAKYDITLAQISENILLGTNQQTGGHSAIFDRLACLGIIGWIPYLCFLFFQIKITKKHLAPDTLIYYYLGLTAALIMLASKNMSNWETWFMALTILPLLLWFPKQKVS